MTDFIGQLLLLAPLLYSEAIHLFSTGNGGIQNMLVGKLVFLRRQILSP